MSFDLAVDIGGVRTLNLKSLELQVPARTLTVLTGPSGAGKTALLVHSIWAGSRRQLMEFETLQASLDVLPQVGQVRSILPSINLSAILETLPARGSIGKFLGLDSLVAKLFIKYGRLSCGTNSCGIVDVETTRTLIQRGAGNLFLGAQFSVAGKDRASIEKAVFSFMRAGYRRFLFDSRWFRLEHDQSDWIDTLPQSTQEYTVLFDSLSSKALDRARLAEAFRLAENLGSSVLEIFQSPGSDHPPRVSSDWKKFALSKTGTCSICGAHVESRATPEGRKISNYFLQFTEAQMLASSVHELLSGLQVRSVLDQIDQGLLVEGLQVLERFGLDELSLDRALTSLSSGERLKLVAAFTELAKLTDTVFLFDEPGRIVFGQDMQTLLDWSQRMLAAGNTVLISGRAGAWVRQADRVLELGPGAGANGGQIVRDYAGGEFQTVSAAPRAALSRKAERILKFSLPIVASQSQRDIEIAENRCTAIVGASGSGKTQLLEQLNAISRYEKGSRGDVNLVPWQETVSLSGALAKHRKNANPILAELIGALDLFAHIFVNLPASRRQGLKKSDFLLTGGTALCESCGGRGYSRSVEESGFEACDYCAGKRFAPHMLQLSFHELNIAEVLAMPVSRALSEFSSSEEITSVLKRAVQFGLGQIRLDTSANELGKAALQRALLSEAIAKKNARSALYLLDQPFAGLDQAEVEFLMFQLRRETESKNTFVYTTHDPLAIAMSDYIIELKEGAKINFFGRAEEFSLSDYV